MKSFIVLFAVVGVALAQRYVDPKQASILAEARYLSGDGSFGAAYVQEDGTDFKEETTADGTRKGSYSYIDPNGKKITIQYTAGKNGFQVSGDHLPKAPQPLPAQAPAAPAPQQYYQPQPQQPVPQYNAQPQYNAIPQQTGEDGSYDASRYEHPYAYDNNLHTRNYDGQGQQYQQPAAPQQFQPQQQFQQQYQPQQHQQFQQPQQQFNHFQQPEITTASPNRFFPPGKLNLNRTPDGYQYSFTQ